MESGDGNSKATVCKTISCLLPSDLEVKRACQLTEFLLEPTVESYYAVETLYNEPDQKLEEEDLLVPNSLRCELLLVLKTQWSFDPEFWDWKALKRHCLALMGEEASIVSSIDLLNDTESPEEEDVMSLRGFNNVPDHLVTGTYELKDVTDKKQKNREMKKLREKGFISARFRNWQAYMQYCVLCDKEFLGHRIVRHAQTHLSKGMYTCPICAQTFTSKDTLIPHVTSHVKQSCKERLTALKTSKKLANPKTAAPVIAAFESKTQHNLSVNGDPSGCNRGLAYKGQTSGPRLNVDCSEDNMCPVGKCRRSFKFFKNLIAHVKAHGDNEEAKTFLEMQSKKVVCQYCRRHFISVTHLNDHLQVHCGVKPYICIQLNCKASFLSNTELLIHRKTHSVFKAKCMFPNCGKIFNAAFKLYDHEAQHYKTFTCKVVDCGKVFHSQQQLDLHQDRHVTQEEENQSSEQTLQNGQPSPSLAEQMQQENWSTETESVDQDRGRLPVPTETLLTSSEEPVDTLKQYTSEHEDKAFSSSHTHNLSNSVIQSVCSSLSETQRYRDNLSDYQRAPQQNQSVPSFEASLNNVLHSQPQMFSNIQNTDSVNYNSNLNLPVKQEPPSTSNCLTVQLPHNSVEPAVLQPLPPTVSPQQRAGNRADNSLEQRERFHCALETCPRHYSSYRSVTKHMKAVHPDFYEQWKVARTNIKTTYAPAQSKSSVEHLSSVSQLQNQQNGRVTIHGVQRQNVIQSPYTNMGNSLNYSDLHSLSSPGLTHNGSLLMANVLNPIVLSQLGSNRNPTIEHAQASGSHSWHTVAGSEQVQNCGSSQVYPPSLQANLQMTPNSSVVSLGVPSCSVMGSVTERPAESLQSPQNSRPQPVRPSYVNGAKEVLEQTDACPSYSSQIQSSLAPGAKIPEQTQTVQNHLQMNFPSANNEIQKSSTVLPIDGPIVAEDEARRRKNKRIKWPAIIKDGKFVCRRCFRQFDSPKSLGGHLSKRTTCKPYNDSELNADLPRSFLDLNSEQTVGTPQLSYNPAAVYQEKHHQSSAATKDYPTRNYPPNNLQTYGSNEANDDILKQIMTESNMSDLFVHTPTPQTMFQNPCVPLGAGERLTGSSVIQHTENVQVKQECSYSSAHYPQPSMDIFSGTEFPDPLFSQILTKNPSAAVPRSAPKNETAGEIHNEGYQSDNIHTPDPDLNSVTHTPIPENQLSPAAISSSQIEVQRKAFDQGIKKRLREQILAGDLQRRNSTCNSSNADAKAISLDPAGTSSNNSGYNPLSNDAKTDFISQGQFFEENSVVMPQTSDEIKLLLNTQSFTCFRDTVIPQQEVPSPRVIVANDPEPEPYQLSASQQQYMTEIQSAFERLNLVREVADQMSNVSVQQAANNQTKCAKVKSRKSISSALIKPFACEKEDCTFSSISSEALWKHLSKTHSYKIEMVNVVKKRYGLYAPFKCQKCSKAFTRNSNLRAHYHSAHKLSAKEIADLDLKRRLAKDAASAAIQNQPVGINSAPEARYHTTVENGTHMCPLKDATQRDYPSQVLGPCTNTVITNNKFQQDIRSTVICPLQAAHTHNQPVTPSRQAQTSTTSFPSVKAAEQWLHEQQRNLPFQHPVVGDSLPTVSPLLTQALLGTAQAKEPQSSNKHSAFNRHSIVQPSTDVTKKTKERKPKLGDAMSPYRPYCCVHQGCVAAFTIQHNLILHYRAVHQSALSALEVNKEQDQSEAANELDHEDEPEAEFPQVSEFRCQVKDCSRVFQQVPNLFQHYVQLHEFSLDKVGSLLSSVRLGKFACGHQGCKESFTAFRSYVAHIKGEHKDIKLAKPEHLNGSFKCEIEGCDRSYATKSNLIRHMMKKHQDLHQSKLKSQQIKDGTKQTSKTLHYQITKTSNGKENIETNKKFLRASDTKRASKSKNNHWVKYGKPSLKSKLEASALCTKKLPLQYPCMIKGCESVMKSERSIMKHYIGHGLSEKYLEQHRSHFIFCKKFPRQKCRSIRSDDSKSDNTSDMSDVETAADASLEGREYGCSKPILRRRAAAGIPVALFDSKLSNDGISDGSVILKRKRGRPRKYIEKIVKGKKIPHPTKADVVCSRSNEAVSSCPAVMQEERTEQSVPLASFKPMGFEMSFLKFLEQSNKSEHPLMRNVSEAVKCRHPFSLSTKGNCVRFSNRQNLKSLSKVKIYLDTAFSSSVSDLMLKQLQDMRPAVLLEKYN